MDAETLFLAAEMIREAAPDDDSADQAILSLSGVQEPASKSEGKGLPFSYLGHKVLILPYVKGCVQNATGDKYHDDQTGHPCSPGGGSSAPAKKPGQGQTGSTGGTKPRVTTAQQRRAVNRERSSAASSQQAATERKKRRLSRGESRKKWRVLKAKFWGSLAGKAVSKVGGLYEATMNAGKRIGEKVMDRLPPKVRKTVAVGIAVGTHVEHVLENAVTQSQVLVEKVARARGADQVQAKKIRRVCAIVDLVARWTVNIPLVHHGLEDAAHAAGLEGTVPKLGAFSLAKLAYYVPVASVAYLGYSAARNPVKTMKAAREFFKKPKETEEHPHPSLWQKIQAAISPERTRRSRTHTDAQGHKNLSYLWKSEEGNPNEDEIKEALLDEYMILQENSQDPEWADAVILSALDATHDFQEALQIASMILQEVPTEPETLDEEMADWLPALAG